MVQTKGNPYSFFEQKKAALKDVEGKMSFCYEWFEEPLPLDDKDGLALENSLQEYIDMQGFNPLCEFILDEDFKPQKPWKLKKSKPAAAEKVLVFADSKELCATILKSAPKGRIKESKVVVDKGEFTEDQIGEMVKEKWDLIIFGSALEESRDFFGNVLNGAEDVAKQSVALSKTYFFLLKQIFRNEGCCKRLAVITRGVFAFEERLHKEVGLSIIQGATLFGMTNSARLEFGADPDRDLPIQYIDTEYDLKKPGWAEPWAPNLFTMIAHELFRKQSFGHNTVRLMYPEAGTKGSGRYVLRQMPSTKYEEAGWEFEMPENGSVIAISGGNGALGLVMGKWLLEKAKEANRKFLRIDFLSRSAKVSESNAKAWNEIEKKAGLINCEVRQASVDFGNQRSVDSYIQGLNGKLGGFIHSAGVLRDGMLAGLNWGKFEEVFNSKHIPALYLHEAIEKHKQPDLEFVWMFSSISVNGNMGQINYSGSNAFLDALCRHRGAFGKCGTAIQFGGWGEIGMASTMDAASRKRLDDSPWPMFETKSGLSGLENALKTGLPNVSVFKLNPPAMFDVTKPCDTVTQCYFRNFTSEMIPTPFPEKMEKEDMAKYAMTCLRLEDDPYKTRTGVNDWLIYNKFIAPWLEDEA